MNVTEVQQVIAAQLEGGERLIWSGAPQQGMVLRPSDAILVPFSLLWGGFACYWEYSVIQSGAPPFFVLWGIPFVLVGLYITVGRFFADAMMRSRTAYAVTDRRILIVSGIMSRSIKSLTIGTLSDVTLDETVGGSGTIAFGPMNPMAGWLGRGAGFGPRAYQPPCFERIPSAREVYNRIREAQTANSRP